MHEPIPSSIQYRNIFIISGSTKEFLVKELILKKTEVVCIHIIYFFLLGSLGFSVSLSIQHPETYQNIRNEIHCQNILMKEN